MWVVQGAKVIVVAGQDLLGINTSITKYEIYMRVSVFSIILAEGVVSVLVYIAKSAKQRSENLV